MSASPSNAATASLLKPFGIVAAVAFVVGFMGYLAATGTDMATLQAQMTSPTPAVSNAATPRAASDIWNLPKKI